MASALSSNHQTLERAGEHGKCIGRLIRRRRGRLGDLLAGNCRIRNDEDGYPDDEAVS